VQRRALGLLFAVLAAVLAAVAVAALLDAGGVRRWLIAAAALAIAGWLASLAAGVLRHR
jgi:hypothetical protein